LFEQSQSSLADDIDVSTSDPVCIARSGLTQQTRVFLYSRRANNWVLAFKMIESASINALMRSAEAHGVAGDLAAAEKVLHQLLEQQPQHAQALHLLGVTQWQAGRGQVALQSLRRAAALAPQHAQTRYVLAKVTEQVCGPVAAIDDYLRAVELAPEFALAWADLGIAQAEAADLTNAIESLFQARRLRGGDVDVAFALGQSLLAVDRVDEAIGVLSEARDAMPADPTLAQALAVALRCAERSDEALQLLQQAAVRNPERVDVQIELGNTLRTLGQVDRAITAFRQALQLDSKLLAAHEGLNRLLFESDDQQHYLHSYQEAISTHPQATSLRVAYAECLTRAERYVDAEQQLREAARLGGEDAQINRLLARALANQGDSAGALEQFRAAVHIAPHEAQGRRDLARMLLMLDDAPAALQQVNAALALGPEDQEAIAYQGLCWRLLGDLEESRLNDYARYVRTYRIPLPAGYSDLNAFNQALNGALDELHLGSTHPPDQTLRGGTQTYGDLFAQGTQVIQQLRASIEQCVRAYIDDMECDPHHPLLARKRDGFRFSASWSCRLKQQGFHTNHVHPLGWISSCYYVSLPEVVTHDTGQQGWIKFGETNLRLGQRERIAHSVQPKEGLLVLFPSYMFHGTVPFDAQQARTTVAFDVVPE
jgi:uncharacterized protein (TIGR02466 family)